ncbi:hypothetical protein MesoLj113a_18590 [Mesorhizobium sp. 113-1-2]|uniref:hypothetical protein n=1 Tax=Mesorhizobium sp. 113-1-2 TaxID=2744515 RepID=UPI0008198A20|nr:hypothetical protein [Mesorhizobium sp. 113-1-2]BAV47465.1 Uncharacterized protein MLTONO_2562 [Mesorhizobium loti]BCG70701.1 hypothetical protein MesoLj113a_18590 [Mesorhizobium sp. 113-1-2]
MKRCILLFVTLVAALFSSSALADKFPVGFKNNGLNGPLRPVTKGGVTTFQIFDRKCSSVDYGDGRGENDCHNGNVRATLIGPDGKIGESMDYRFDLWVDPSFNYPGFFNGHAMGFLPGGLDSRLRIASWEGPFIHNFLYMLKVDATKGVTFLGNECQSPARFGSWVAFSMKVRWAADRTGWIRVTCDDKLIYSADNVPTNQAPHCYITNQCEPGVAKNPKWFTFCVGPVMAGFGPEWEKYGLTSQFTAIQPEGITIKMRNLSAKKGVKP